MTAVWSICVLPISHVLSKKFKTRSFFKQSQIKIIIVVCWVRFVFTLFHGMQESDTPYLPVNYNLSDNKTHPAYSANRPTQLQEYYGWVLLGDGSGWGRKSVFVGVASKGDPSTVGGGPAPDQSTKCVVASAHQQQGLIAGLNRQTDRQTDRLNQERKLLVSGIQKKPLS